MEIDTFACNDKQTVRAASKVHRPIAQMQRDIYIGIKQLVDLNKYTDDH